MSILSFNDNDEQAQATIYRGPNQVYGPVDCNIQQVQYLINPGGIASGLSSLGLDDLTTHKIYIDVPEVGADGEPVYWPMLEDYVVVTGTHRKALDGRYVTKQYPRTFSAFDGSMDYIELECRNVDAKKPGDTIGADNSGKIRFYGRRG